MQYAIATGDCTMSLKEQVDGFIARGWVLQGGVSIACFDRGNMIEYRFAQAMVKECNPRIPWECF